MDASGQIGTVIALQIFVFATFCHPAHPTVDVPPSLSGQLPNTEKKLSLSRPLRHMGRGGAQVTVPFILNLNGGEWLTSRRGLFTPHKNTGTH